MFRSGRRKGYPNFRVDEQLFWQEWMREGVYPVFLAVQSVR
jgi:hypothetical protein